MAQVAASIWRDGDSQVTPSPKWVWLCGGIWQARRLEGLLWEALGDAEAGAREVRQGG